METWKELSEEEYKNIWDKFFRSFEFKPSTHPEDWPSFKEPLPSITFDISEIYTNDKSKYYELLEDLLKKTFFALRECKLENKFLYALDWNHPSYYFTLNSYFNYINENEWKVSVFPNGDYYIFLSEDFSFGILGHPWERTICVFGQSLLDTFEKYKPSLFNNIKRINGKEV